MDKGTRDGRRVTRRLRAASLFLILGALHCSSGGGGGGVIADELETGFAGSATAPSANMVHLTGTPVGETVRVTVMVDGPTTSSDLYAFAFDLMLSDPTKFELVPGSVTFGTALVPSAGQSEQALADQDGARVTVGVSKLGGGAGNGVSGGTASVVSLTFRALEAGTSTLWIDASPPHAGPAAIDSAGATVGTIQFDGAAATLTAM